MSIEHAMYIGLVAMLFRYLWKLLSALFAGNDGPVGQLGVAMGGLAQ
jgi:hypothetical protein